MLEKKSDGYNLLKAHFAHYPILLCNLNNELPSVFSVGGDWNSIIKLIEERDVFYSKLYKGRVTYLSQEFYWSIKPYKQRWERVSAKSKSVYLYINAMGLASTIEIKNSLMLSNKIFNECMEELLKELLVTAIERERNLNCNWSSFYWGTYKKWEETVMNQTIDKEDIFSQLAPFLKKKEIEKLLK